MLLTDQVSGSIGYLLGTGEPQFQATCEGAGRGDPTDRLMEAGDELPPTLPR
ncbi:MAG: hypothetical protein AVDCRST_MAG68-5708 [uncultured Gemmatimonadetes bacterium]|uniref:Uncharacterized protein n=1 Tax=uncultured Gemmatimonadota bacterium TaxID=203437 RepID=A0A6J4MVZ7_9BACT|nr:MAG: hypothetical protein AVDCRST_MAG68-5708 [uncultured Gemmatimonadota bacterium]